MKVIDNIKYDMDEDRASWAYRHAWGCWMTSEGIDINHVLLNGGDEPELRRMADGTLQVRYVQAFMDDDGHSVMCARGEHLDNWHVAARWVSRAVKTLPSGVLI